ncbi:MAG: alpha/beta fold hydrolase [Pseudomonadota bacterium]
MRRAGYELANDAVERALRAGTHAGMLEDYFGEAAYRELHELALEASAVRTRGGPRVLILPGIMGSTLGIENRIGPFDDVIWLDPLDVGLGNLTMLALDSRHRIVPLGVILFTYLRLKLRLQRAGYDADYFPFDWRKSIDELGATLAERLASEKPGVQLVAHSMGGLVARAALEHPAGSKVSRLIMLGTPNFGSFVPIQALRGTAGTARALAALDPFHSVEELSRLVFRTFPGLCQMFPAPERFDAVDLFSPKGWPRSGPGPDFALLKNVASVRARLADADSRFYLIAGVNRETATGITLNEKEFTYELSDDGDGTVPLAFAQLPGATTYYVEEDHGALPNNAQVGAAVVDLLTSGSTERLPKTPPRRLARSVRRVSDSELLERPAFDGRRGGELSSREVRNVAREFIAPEARDTAGAAAAIAPTASAIAPEGAQKVELGLAHPFEGLTIGRRRQHQIEICLAQGSIVSARAEAYVLGVYKGVEPAGPASAIDLAIDGAIKDFVARRMFSANAGEIFVVPTSGYLVHASSVLLAGLGSFDQFNSEVQTLVAENVVRTFVRTGVDDFATVLFGTGSGHSVAASLYNHLVGTVRGILDAGRSSLRRITFCELDPERFAQMKEELLRLASTRLFHDVEVLLDEIQLPPPPEPPAPDRAVLGTRHPQTYLHVRREPSPAGTYAFRSTVLTAGPKATVIAGVQEVSDAALQRHLTRIAKDELEFSRLEQFGSELARLVLAEDVLAVLDRLRDCHLVVVHDAAASRIPWETVCVRNGSKPPWFPALECGLSRRYIAENMSVSKWLEERRRDAVLNILLVTNPTGDLDGAERESQRVKHLFRAERAVSITELAREKATKPALLAAFRSGEFDVLHYAGHALFDEKSPSLSGILCANEQVLTGAELASLSRLPSLVFFNACEAGRVRGERAGKKKAALSPERIQENVGLAEAFLRGGVPNYIGTYWPVGDAAAERFSSELYRALLRGEAIGTALGRSRRALFEMSALDWANYILYGASDFALKIPSGAG